MQNMLKHPLITINPDMNAISRLGDVVFPTQWCGIEYEGTAYRMDHVPIMLRKVVEPPEGILNDEELLTKILEEVRAIKAQNPETETKAELKARNKLAPKIELKHEKKKKKAEAA
jgi:formylmethanofuran dehydrogenase subunit B